MEQAYWLGRKRTSAANAKRASSAEARLAHLDLAGRYSIKAADCEEAVSMTNRHVRAAGSRRLGGNG